MVTLGLGLGGAGRGGGGRGAELIRGGGGGGSRGLGPAKLKEDVEVEGGLERKDCEGRTRREADDLPLLLLLLPPRTPPASDRLSWKVCSSEGRD